MSDVENFEQLKNKIDALKVKKMASETYVKRLTEELDNCKKEIKDEYHVEIEDFANAIDTMKKEYENKLKELVSLVEDAEQKIKEN